jgi:hypothetical protein
MSKAKAGGLHLTMKGSAEALLSWLHGWQAAEKHYFKNKKPPGNMSVLLEKRILSELQGERQPSVSKKRSAKRRSRKTATTAE